MLHIWYTMKKKKTTLFNVNNLLYYMVQFERTKYNILNENSIFFQYATKYKKTK